MTLWAVLATGSSMSKEIADFVRGKAKVIAISDSFRIAPWADALVSHDRSWWRRYPEALKFQGRKFCRFRHRGTEIFNTDLPSGSNSGFMGMNVAASKEVWGKSAATKIILLGFDMHGSHFFGRHPPQLKNTSIKRRAVHLKQFELWRGCEVINCTKGSALKFFKSAELSEVMNGNISRSENGEAF